MPTPSSAEGGMRLFGSPHRYAQGPGLIEDLGPWLVAYGSRPLVVIDAFLAPTLSDTISASIARTGGRAAILPFAGEITYATIDALAAEGGTLAPTVIVGVGGGKSLDFAKAVSVALALPMVTVPTIASNDSPTSASIAVYDERHVMIAVDRMPRSPDLVLVDTAMIARAPARFLRAGIGDAVAKKFEAEGCAAGTGRTPFGTRPLLTPIVVADACYRTLRVHAAKALAAVEAGTVDEHLEATVEATILMSGLGFESGGLSLAHSTTRGLVLGRGTKDAIHGDQVAYGMLVQLAAEGRTDAFILDVVSFLRSVGLPCRLADLGMTDPSEAEIGEIARLTMTAPHLQNLAVPVDAGAVAAAIGRVERLGGAPARWRERP